MTNATDALRDGDVLGMLQLWADVFSQGFAAFADAFAPQRAAEEEAIANLVPVSSESMLTDFSVAIAIVALAWVAFVVLTHTKAWKKVSGMEIPAPVAFTIGAFLFIVAFGAFFIFTANLDTSIWLGLAGMVLALAVLIPATCAVVFAIEKAYGVLAGIRHGRK